MSTALKPCPFCGGENILLDTRRINREEHFVCCLQCQATFVGDSERECIEKWNKREGEGNNDK